MMPIGHHPTEISGITLPKYGNGSFTLLAGTGTATMTTPYVGAPPFVSPVENYAQN
jgi:hypothetical protein